MFNLYPINNTFHIENTNDGDYEIQINYISEYKCDIWIWRFDNDIIYPDIKIFIETELIIFKNYNCSNFQVETETKLFPIDTNYKQIIPKTIIQTNDIEDINSKNAVDCLKYKNPEYNYLFFNKNQRRLFINEYFEPDICLAYDLLVSGAYQADLFRYCYLYINGGCYFDYRIILRKPLREFIKPEDNFLITIDYEKTNSMDREIGTSYLNSIIFSTPKETKLLLIINECKINILDKQQYFINDALTRGVAGCLDLTGPTLLYKILKQYIRVENIPFKHIIKNNDEKDYRNFQIVEINTQTVILTKKYKNIDNNNHYSVNWSNIEIFYKNMQLVDNLIILIYPHIYNDTFEFCIHNNNLIIIRDQKQGWGLNLKLKIINNITGLYDDFVVGSSSYYMKSMKLPDQFCVNLPFNVFYSSNISPENINIYTDVVIAIPSIINISNNPILGYDKRSKLSGEERYNQTIKQLQVIRQKVPNTTIILLEYSTNLTTEQLTNLSSLSNYVIRYNNIGDDYEYCHNTFYNKGLGEIYGLVHITELIKDKPFKWFCKFGGRYCMSDIFNINDFKVQVPSFYAIEGNDTIGKFLAHTEFYSIPKKFLNIYIEIFKIWLEKDTTEPAEYIFTFFLKCLKHKNRLPYLGVYGHGANNNSINTI